MLMYSEQLQQSPTFNALEPSYFNNSYTDVNFVGREEISQNNKNSSAAESPTHRDRDRGETVDPK